MGQMPIVVNYYHLRLTLRAIRLPQYGRGKKESGKGGKDLWNGKE